MKKSSLFTLLCVMVISSLHAQSNTFPSTGAAGIGTLTPNASSLLDITSTTKGILIPRMTKAQRDLIASPVTGLLIYQTNNTPGFYYYSGTAWAAVTPKSKGWALTGNAGTVPGTNFLGTTDAQPLLFKVNNQKAGYLDHLNGNTGFGYQTLNNNAGTNNTANGSYALYSNTTASYNTATGTQSLYFNSTGSGNTANGSLALFSNTIGSNNTAIGGTALYTNTTGNYNTATGNSALIYNTTGGYNTANGYSALNKNTTGYSNVAIGTAALYSSTTANNLVAVGDSALYNQSTRIDGKYYNTAIGSKALFNNTTGNYNNANGYQGLYYNTTGSFNTATGSYALFKNTIGTGNTANGNSTLFENTMGAVNTACGDFALYSNTTGNENTATGYNALWSNTVADFNTAYGTYALSYNSTGGSNTAIGDDALYTNITGSANTALGRDADVSAGDLSNATAIGCFAIVNASNKIVLGANMPGMVIGGYGAWSNLSDGRFKENIKEDVPGLKFITKLRPVTYTVNTQKLEAHIMQNMPDSIKTKRKQKPEDYARAAAKIQTGFVAQEVEKTAKELNYDFDGVNAPQNPADNYSLAYGQFVVPLVKAVQELSKINDTKDAKIDAQDKKINDQQKQIDDLKAIMLQIQQNLKNCTSCAGNPLAQQSKIVSVSNASLEQNIPNPFNHVTTINYNLPQQFSSAKIIVTDKSGKPVKQINLSGGGKGSLNVDASTLASGTYQYSLYVDGRLIGTKQMVLTR